MVSLFNFGTVMHLITFKILKVNLILRINNSRTSQICVEFQFSFAAINDTDSRNNWQPLAPTKEAQARFCAS